MSTGLTSEQIVGFVRDGYVRVEVAFPRELAEQGRALLWAEMGLSPDDPSGWTEAVIRLPGSGAEPFRRAATSEPLLLAFDQLVGPRCWVKPVGLGTFPIRFPNHPEPNDTGWHCDGNFGEVPYRLNLRSRGRALLMLFLFSDVGEEDAPTRIRVGSHLDVPPVLATTGDDGMSFLALAEHMGNMNERPVVHATGLAGDVYLCHPFLVHAAQAHHGQMPRFIAQPPPRLIGELEIDRDDHVYSPLNER